MTQTVPFGGKDLRVLLKDSATDTTPDFVAMITTKEIEWVNEFDDTFLIGSEMIGLTTVRSDAATFPAVAQLIGLAADARSILGSATKIGYSADWTEYASHRPADGSGDVYFHLDPLWSNANIDFVGIDNYMPLADWRDGFDHLDAKGGTFTSGVPSPYDPGYLTSNVAAGELFDWYYPTPAAGDAQARAPIADTAHGEHWVFRLKDLRGWWANPHRHRPGGVRQAQATAWVPQGKPVRFIEVGCPAVDKGMNQPNVFVDPKSSESFLPYYSNGRRDLAAQRAYLEATLAYWQGASGNPVSSVYGGRMVDPERLFVWTWDARPYPDFPRQAAVWSDGPNYRLGHWINGRLGLTPIADVVAELCGGLGVPIDVGGLHGLVEGYAIAEVQTPRASLDPLRACFFFDAAESAGRLVFAPLARAPAMQLTADDLVARGSTGGDYRRTRGEETALPGVVALTYIDPHRGYQSVSVEAPAGLDYALFDFAVNSGPTRAVIGLQRALSIADDGRLGPVTLAALAGRDVPGLVNALCDGRLAFPRALSTWPRFGRGWGRRVEEVRAAALALHAAPASAPACPTCGRARAA